MPTRTKQTWDRNPANNSTCLTHGPYVGLICTPCITTLPPRQNTGSARWVSAPTDGER